MTKIIFFTCFLNSRSRAFKPLSTLPLVYSSYDSHNFAKQGKQGNFPFTTGDFSCSVTAEPLFACRRNSISIIKLELVLTFLFSSCIGISRRQNSKQTVFWRTLLSFRFSTDFLTYRTVLLFRPSSHRKLHKIHQRCCCS